MSTNRPIYKIAHEIQDDWKKVNYAAKPYLNAMYGLSDIRDSFHQDSARSILTYFLANASTWRGETAKRIKQEIKQLLN